MKRWIATLALALFFIPLLACGGAPDTPESARLKEIDARLEEISKKLDNPSLDGDTAERLRDERMELNAERTNIVQEANQAR